jgi:Ca-activated chloride channel family protein
LDYSFEHIEFVWILLGIPLFLLLFFILIQWKKKVMRRTGDKRLVKALISNFSPGKFALKFILLAIAFGLGAVAVMNPRKPAASNNFNRKGIDLAITLDVSKSMLATDIQPSRLERARQFIDKLMSEMPDDRIALVLFAGRAYLQMPLTTDHGAARMYVSSAGPDAVPQKGTVISDALTKSASVFNTAERRFKAVILITDGEDHDAEAAKTAKELAKEGVMINCIGIGSPEGSTITEPSTGELKKDENGNTVISKLNEDILKEIAGETNGIYIRLQSTDEAVSTLMKHLSQIDRKAFGDISMMNFDTYYGWFAGGMFFFLLVETIISERKKIKT